MKKNKIMKCIIVGMLTTAMLVSGIIVSKTKANAATEMAEGDKVCYEEMNVTKFETFYGDEKKVAPTKEGYLFGGWYLDSALTKPVKARDDVDDKVYAKFVPAYVLSVKAQNYSDTEAGKEGTTPETNTTTTRVVSSVDASLLYQEVGFKVKIEGKDEVTVKTTKVWEKLAAGTGDKQKTYQATQIFGAHSKYFFVLNVNKIPETKWGEAIYVRPYWVTEDGTTVEGLGKYVYTEDGVKRYISVPINLNNVTEGIAAGFLKVTYDSEYSLTFKEAVVGKVFTEMEVNAQGSSLTCVGNVTTLEDVKVGEADDMYITLRFQLPDGATLGEQEFYNFEVSAEDFINIDEDDVTFNVWNVQY